MVVFYKTDDCHVDLKTDQYLPVFSIEILKVSMRDPDHLDDLIESIKSHNWDLMFLIMMYDCPEEVFVDCDYRETTLMDIFGYDMLSLEVIEEEIHHKHPNKH
jgi:hypothetical protein